MKKSSRNSGALSRSPAELMTLLLTRQIRNKTMEVGKMNEDLKKALEWLKSVGYSYADKALEGFNRDHNSGKRLVYRERVWSQGTYYVIEEAE